MELVFRTLLVQSAGETTPGLYHRNADRNAILYISNLYVSVTPSRLAFSNGAGGPLAPPPLIPAPISFLLSTLPAPPSYFFFSCGQGPLCLEGENPRGSRFERKEQPGPKESAMQERASREDVSGGRFS